MQIKRPESLRPLPENAKKVFSGILYDVYHWQQVLFDGSTTTYEKLKGQDVVSVIPVTEDGKILITHQQQPGTGEFITNAGGRVENGEDPLEAIKRELLEETGYVSEDYILWKAFQPSPRIEQVIYIFIARNCIKVSEQNLDAGEKIELELVSFEAFTQIAISDSYNDKDIKMEFLKALALPEKMQVLKKIILG
jgi:8-oxo-dGTP pyrophosphatase MutT (NUDIX family)